MKNPPSSSQPRAAYIFSMELPNRRAHAVQVMKNAQAWAKHCPEFEMLLNTGYRAWRELDFQEVQRGFGNRHLFPLAAYPFYPFESTPDHPLRGLFHALAAWRCARRGVNLIYTRSYHAGRHAIARGIPVITEAHGVPHQAPEVRAIAAYAHHPLFAGLVTLTAPLKRHYMEIGIPEERILVLPDGVDLERFDPPMTRLQARQHLGLPPDQPTAVYVGHLYAGRGIEEILHAAVTLPLVNFLLVGGMEGDVGRWREEVQRQGLANVTLTGFVENGRIPPYLWAADLLLMPYSTACPTAEWMSPLKMFEYMAAGRAILATDLPALREVLRHGENAWLAPPDDGAALATGITHLLAHPEQATAMGEQARRDVRPFSWDQRVAAILNHARERGFLARKG